MPIPEFIVELRRHIGHAPLWLPCVTAVVIRDQHVLLVKRADNQAWTPVTGIVEPVENPADCAV
jgi:ADP-ribose pyrophosphatase YjhB (NUDIX family)